MAKRPTTARPVCAPGLPIGIAARRGVARWTGDIAPVMAAARAGSVEGVHQLRVVTRRLRSALAVFAPALPARRAALLHDELAWLGHTAGPVRDLDVLAIAIDAQRRKIEPSLRPAAATIVRHVRERRHAAHAGLAAALASPRAARLAARLTVLADSPTGAGGRAPCWRVAPDLARPLVRAVLRAGRDVDAASGEKALHRLRVRTKRLRYALETLEGLAGDRTRRLLGRLVRLQQLLGDHRDAVAQGAWLRAETTAFVGDAEALVVVGALGEALRRRARRTARAVPRAFDRVARRKRVAAALAELGRAPRAGAR